jgi:acylphosphatase
MADDQKAVRVRIFGRVQGVWFRGWTVDQATRLGLAGWVRNRHDGSAEALFVGAVGSVDAMLAHCCQGPPTARVDTVEIETAQGMVGTGFVQKPTV